jgi:cytoskeleton protein RodZ
MFQIGQSLHDARLAQGIDLADVEKATMIRTRYLTALETERFDLLPGDAYTRLFLREYAEFLGLDSTPFLDQLDADQEETEPLPFMPLPPPGRRVGRRRLIALAAAGAGVITISLVAWKLGGGQNPGLPVGHTAPRPVQAPPPPRVSHPRPRPHRTEPAGPHLVLTAARGPVWLLVRLGSQDGKTLYESTLQTGGSLAFGRRTLWIRIGAPPNLDLRVDGRTAPFPPSSAPENVLVPVQGSLRPA